MIRRPPRSTRTDTLLSLHDALPISDDAEVRAGARHLPRRPARRLCRAERPGAARGLAGGDGADAGVDICRAADPDRDSRRRRTAPLFDRPGQPRGTACRRSEEHTSELQSLMRTSYAVFFFITTLSTLTNALLQYPTLHPISH